MDDLAVLVGGELLGQEPRHNVQHVQLVGALQQDHRQVAVVDRDVLADMDRLLREIGERVGILGQRGDAGLGPFSDGGLDLHRIPQVVAVIARQCRPAVVPGARGRLQFRILVDPLDHGGIDAGTAGEDEVAVVDQTEVDLPGAEVVGQRQQVLGRVDHVVGDAERAADHVGIAAGQEGHRDVSAGEAVDDLVDGAVTTEGHHQVVTAVLGVAADLGRVVLALGCLDLDLETPLEGIDDQVLEAVRDGRRIRVDDDQQALLGAVHARAPYVTSWPRSRSVRGRCLRAAGWSRQPVLPRAGCRGGRSLRRGSGMPG